MEKNEPTPNPSTLPGPLPPESYARSSQDITLPLPVLRPWYKRAYAWVAAIGATLGLLLFAVWGWLRFGVTPRKTVEAGAKALGEELIRAKRQRELALERERLKTRSETLKAETTRHVEAIGQADAKHVADEWNRLRDTPSTSDRRHAVDLPTIDRLKKGSGE